MIEIKYSSFAAAPDGIKIDKLYSFGQDSKGYFYSDSKSRTYLDLDEIKAIFTPVKSSWDSVLRNTKMAKKEQ